MKRRLTINVTFECSTDKKMVDMNMANSAITAAVEALAKGTDETVEINLYVSTRSND